MFDFDNFREIWSTIQKNKLRTFLTGFSVSWGIFILIVLLAASNGLSNGIRHNFADMSQNTVEVWPRYTTLPYKGLQPNRAITFKEGDYHDLRRDFPNEIEYMSAIIGQSATIAFDEESVIGRLRGVSSEYAKINYIQVLAGNGRFLNELDVLTKRKVMVIGPYMAKVLFRDVSPLGQYVKVDNIMYQVVGVYEDKNNENNPPAYIPFSTAQILYRKGFGIGSFAFTIKNIITEEDNDAFEKRLRTWFGRRHQFDPEDTNAIGMFNMAERVRMLEGMTNGISLFMWLVGIGTLMAGIVGVSNIMLITVRERTREFGIRKAIGAKPSSILQLIIFESIMVTAIFGYLGMISGIGLSELINYVMMANEAAAQGTSSGNIGEGESIFRNPTVSLGISLGATCVIVIAGVFAGYFPARKAVKISAVEAMREE